MALLVFKVFRIGIPILLVWGVLGVYVPVATEEFKYQARMTTENFQAVFPNGVKGFLMPSWSLNTPPAWARGYVIDIPALGVREPIVEGVDAGDRDTYMKALRDGVAHAAGTVLPGQTGVGYYFAHSSGLPFWGGRTATFAMLHKLKPGDEIVVYKETQKYVYKVMEKRIVEPEDVELLTTTDQVERIVLQTCWPLGTSLQRLLVVGVRVK